MTGGQSPDAATASFPTAAEGKAVQSPKLKQAAVQPRNWHGRAGFKENLAFGAIFGKLV
jgi:hypothetical protein